MLQIEPLPDVIPEELYVSELAPDEPEAQAPVEEQEPQCAATPISGELRFLWLALLGYACEEAEST